MDVLQGVSISPHFLFIAVAKVRSSEHNGTDARLIDGHTLYLV
jgi:hypothetical protein